jgi:hypothetical protein
MRSSARWWAFAVACSWLGASLAPAEPPAPSASSPDAEAGPSLTISAPIACRDVNGFEDYEPLPNAALTSDEKLIVYYTIQNYRVETSGESYRVHLIQDGQIRRRGSKAVLHRKPKMLDYDQKKDEYPSGIYMKNIVSLKGLKPGEYEFDVILHDALAKGSAPVTKALKFKIVPAVLPKAEAHSDEGRETPSTQETTKARRPGRKAVPSRP